MATKTADGKGREQRDRDLPEYLGLPTGAALVDVSVATLRRWLTQKRLRRFKVGGHTVVKTTELLGLVREAK